MSQTRFYEVMRRFEEALIGVTGRALLPEKHEVITPEDDRARCAKALDALSMVWALDPQDLTKLKQLTQGCLELLARGDINAALFAAKEIQDLLTTVREQGRTSKES